MEENIKGVCKACKDIIVDAKYVKVQRDLGLLKEGFYHVKCAGSLYGKKERSIFMDN